MFDSFIRQVIKKSVAISIGSLLFISNAWSQNEKNNFSSLDYGLYFFGENNQQEKFQLGKRNSYFDPAKPTLIYIHGWQNGMVFDGRKEVFMSDTIVGAPKGYDLAKEWRDAGYNVSTFYWTQFADEQEVKSAEEKIWTANGRSNMRWLTDDCNQSNQDACYREGVKGVSVSDLFVDAYINAFSDAAPVRIAGHSLGSQLAIVGSHKLLEAARLGMIDESKVPYRIALLDPAFLKGKRDFLGVSTGQKASDYAKALIDSGILMESYRFSLSTNNGLIGDANMSLMNQTAFAEVKPWYFYFWQLVEKHVSARWWYLHSLQAGELPVEGQSMPALSAATPDSWVRYWMNSDRSLDQTEGRFTTDVKDDEFSIKLR